MSCGRGEGKFTLWNRYEKLLLKEYYYQQMMQEDRRRKTLDLKRFGLAAKAHAKICGEIPADMFCLKKPILPNRWINFREGWCSAAWGFTHADLTPYAIEEAVDKLLKEINNPYFKKKIGTLTMPEGFTFGEEGR